MGHRGQRLRLRGEQAAPVGGPRRAIAAATPARRLGGAAAQSRVASLLELQRLAGNRAVAAQIGSWRNGRIVVGSSRVTLATHPSAPPEGVRQIRESRGGGGLLGRTVASIDPSPPLLRAEPPVRTENGWTSRAVRTRTPEPYIEEWWPTAGRHESFPHIYLDVSAEWEARLKAGEDEHVADHTVGWQATWGTVGQTIADLAQAPGAPQATADAARRDLWRRFVGALPPDLQPAGSEPTDEAQTTRWGFEPTTTLFRRLFGATQARDGRGWHTTTSELDRTEGSDEIRHVSGDTRIGEVSSEDLIADSRSGARAAR